MKRVTSFGRMSRRTWLSIAVAALTLGLLVPMVGASAASANGVPLNKGDVLAGVGNGIIKHFDSSGTLLDELNNTTGATYNTGMCFDSAGNLYATDFNGGMSKFDASGNLLSAAFGSGFNADPESCAVNATDKLYVGQADGEAEVLNFDTGGNLLASFQPARESRGTDWVDLAGDQCTLTYTSEGNSIFAYNVCKNEQLPNVAEGLPGPCYAHRILPDGSELVACTSVVERTKEGKIVQTYNLEGAGLLFALNIDPDGKTFWTGDLNTGQVWRINIETGTVVTTFNSAINTALGGLSIVGERTCSEAEIKLSPATAENPVGTNHTLTAVVTECGVPQKGATVTFKVTGMNPQEGTATTNEAGEATFTYKGNNAGTDTIVASFTDSKSELQESNPALKKWVEKEKPKEECTKAFGVGHIGTRGTEGLNLDNNVNTTLVGHQQLEVITPNRELHIHLTKLTSATCAGIAGGLEFSGKGTARLNGAAGYEVSFSIAIVGSKTYLTLVLEKGGIVVYSITHEQLNPKSHEHIS